MKLGEQNGKELDRWNLEGSPRVKLAAVLIGLVARCSVEVESRSLHSEAFPHGVPAPSSPSSLLGRSKYSSLDGQNFFSPLSEYISLEEL